jgi:transposase-like protein
METPKTLLEAINFFQDGENSRLFMIAVRWADGIVRCPRCGSEDVSYMPNAKQYHCKAKHDKPKFSLKVGTIFEDSPIGLEKWLPAAWLISNCKNGISSYEIARALGVTQKSAWHMLHRLRHAMNDDAGQIGTNGLVEMDETFVGGKAKNMHKAKRVKAIKAEGTFKGKTIVVGMLERGGRVRAEVVETRSREVLHELARTSIIPGSTVITDEHHPYRGIDFVHEVINHAESYVRGHIHTNGIESFWSLLKRALGGTYISVEPFHLQAYIAEQVFRYNHRKDMNDGARFVKVLSQIVGKRLTYAELVGRAAQSPA